MKRIVAVVIILSSPVCFANTNKVAANIEISSRNFMVEQKQDAGGFTGTTAEVLAKNVPVKPSCVAQIDDPEVITGHTDTLTWQNSIYGESDEAVVIHSDDHEKSCRFKLLYEFGKDQYLYGYREVTSRLDLDVQKNVSFGPQFGLGMFGAILSPLTLGLSDLLIDSANNIKTSLEAATSAALSKRVSVQDIVSNLTLLMCEVEAAKLARSRACHDSNLADYSDYVNSVRSEYKKFISKQ